MTTKKEPMKKKAAAQKAAAKKKAAKKAAPHKRPASKSVITTQSANQADIKIQVTAEIPESAKEIAKQLSSLVTANDIISPSLRKRVLRWFTRK